MCIIVVSDIVQKQKILEKTMVSEKIILGQGSEFPLNGMLTLPEDAEGPVPAAVLVHGSGSSNMDEKIFANTPFKDIAEGLAERGVATIRYDKRSFIYGRKLVKNTGFTVYEETIEDAILAAAMLREDPRINAKKVFIIGHSMGGMLAPRIDAMGGDFAGLIIMAGTPRLLEEVLFEQFDTITKSYKGLTAFLVNKQASGLRKKLDGIYEMDDEKAKSIKVMGGTRAFYWKEMGENDVPSFIAKIKKAKPILVMQGAKDAQVSVEYDFNEYEKLLEGRKKVYFRLYPELNHLFMPAVYGDLKNMKKEYKIPSKVETCVLDDIAAFINKGKL